MERILIVDDEVSITSALSYFLEKEGFETILAHTGRDALTQLSTFPNLVVLDIMLPDINGHEICKIIRQSETYIPILMLTAKDTMSDRIVGLDTGADAYITKPYNSQEVVAQIRALLRMRADKNEDVIKYDDIVLSLTQRRVTRNGQSIELTEREFKILQLLMTNPGTAFGREMILRSVWGYNPELNTRAIDTNIQRLRSKVEHDSTKPKLIETVRGFGYRLRPIQENDDPESEFDSG